MNVQLIAHTPNPQEVVAAAAKLCYSHSTAGEIMDNLTPEKTEKFLNLTGNYFPNRPEYAIMLGDYEYESKEAKL